MANGKGGALLLAAVLLCGRAFADDPLPQTRQAAIAMEAKDALPLTSFYDPPDPLPGAAPGTLIRSEPFDGYDLPKSLSEIKLFFDRAFGSSCGLKPSAGMRGLSG